VAEAEVRVEVRVEPWEVYARHDDEARAHHIGTVRAAGERDARLFAVTMYDERKWRELFVIPKAEVIQVIVPV
jgi:1,2-phenylacetyl-CoA epoxidase PaaB subunit